MPDLLCHLVHYCTAGVAQEAVQDVYTAAITQAGTSKEQQDLSNAFVAAFAQLPGKQDSNKLLETLLSAVDYTITFNGCEQPKPFVTGELVPGSALIEILWYAQLAQSC